MAQEIVKRIQLAVTAKENIEREEEHWVTIDTEDRDLRMQDDSTVAET